MDRRTGGPEDRRTGGPEDRVGSVWGAAVRCSARCERRYRVRMQDPQRLRVTAYARALAVELYSATSRFPSGERFGLTAQMRRAAVSVGSNIAEGCGRSGARELIHFLHVSLGSASELEFQLLLALDLALLSSTEAEPLLTRTTDLKRMLTGLIKSLQKRKARQPATP
jgi:four helix bundle protein